MPIRSTMPLSLNPTPLPPSSVPASITPASISVPRVVKDRLGAGAKPPRPPNAWILFRSDKLRQLPPPPPGQPKLPQAEVSKIIAEQWRDMNEDVRAMYEQRADAAKAKHLRLYPNYRFAPLKKAEKDCIRKERRRARQREIASNFETSPLVIESDVIGAKAASSSILSTSAAELTLPPPYKATMSRPSPLPGESAGTPLFHYSQGPGQLRCSLSEVVNFPTQERLPTPPDPPLSDHVNTTNDQSSSTSTFPRIVKPPDKLDPTLSCWISNMKRLTRLIDCLHELASSARAEYRSQLSNNVEALRAMSKKQEERFIKFLQSSDEYAIKYLSDISVKIQQDKIFLDKLEGRVEAAKKFCGEVVDLKTRYELGTVAAMKDLRAKTISRPLPEDRALFDEVDSVLTEIWKCYEELERFWSEEIRCATEAYERRRVDPKDIERWKDHRASLKQTIDSWENQQPSSDSQTLCCDNACSSEGADKLCIGFIASSMSSAMGLLTPTLDRLHSSHSVQYSRSDLRPVYVSFAANRNMCLSLLQQFVDYGEKVLAFCLPSIASSTSSRTGASQDLWELIMRLRSEMTNISPEKAAGVQGSFWFKCKYKKALSLEQKLISGMNNLLEKWGSVTDGHDLSGDALLEQLHAQWEEAERSMSANLADLQNGRHSTPLASTGPPSRMKRWLNCFRGNRLRV